MKAKNDFLSYIFIFFYIHFLFIDDLVSAFRDVYKVEAKVREMGSALAESSFILRSIKRRKSTKFQVSAHRRFSGSFAEGGFSAAWFVNNENSETSASSKQKTDLDFDLDVEITIGRQRSSMKHCVIDNGDGFAYVKHDGKKCKLNSKYDDHYSKGKMENKPLSKDGFLLPNQVKFNLLNRSKFFVQTSFLKRFSSTFGDISVDDFNEKVTKATYQQIYKLRLSTKFQMYLTIDLGITIQLDWKTEYIRKWEERERWCPDLASMSAELNKTYLIAKTRGDEKLKEDSILFRYSFAHIEQKIVSLQTTPQRVVYYIAKVIFYKHVKSIDSDLIQSFLLKNTMLWICERIPATNEIWTYPRAMEAIDLLFERLELDLEKDFMAYYFIPELNVLKKYPKRVLTRMKKAVRRIRLNVLSCAEETFSETPKEVLSSLVEKMSEFSKFIDLLKVIRRAQNRI